MSDNIADMLTRIRNGYSAKLMYVSFPSSKLKANVLSVLQSEGYILGYKNCTEGRTITVALKYSRSGSPAIAEIHKVSKPGKRVYSSVDNFSGYYNNMGIYIISTSRGVMSDRQARALNVGGEVVCKVF